MSLDLVGWAVRAVAPLRSDSRAAARPNLEPAPTIWRNLATGRDPARSFSLGHTGVILHASHRMAQESSRNAREGPALIGIVFRSRLGRVRLTPDRALVNRAALRLGPPASIPRANYMASAMGAHLCHFSMGLCPSRGEGCAGQGPPAAGSPRSSASRYADRCADPLVPRGPLGG
jgi:hypothetical protein